MTLPTVIVGNNYTFRIAYRRNPGIPTPHYEINRVNENDRHGSCYFPQELIGPDVVFDIRGPESNSWVYMFRSDHQPFISSYPKSSGRLADFLVNRINT